MKHRERVQMALNHETPDRCPMQVSFTPEFADRLREDLKVKGKAPHNPHGGGNTYELERALGEDMLLSSVGWANSYYLGSEPYTDEWGISWHSQDYETPYGKGYYTEISEHPLAEDSAIETYHAPDPNRPELYAEAERVLRDFKDEYWIVGVTVTTIFETAWGLRGYERIFMDMVNDPEYVERLMDIPYQYHLTAAKKLAQMGVDMIWIGDDVGAQNDMVISPKHWRRFLKPHMANFIAELKRINPNIKVAYHTDGNVDRIIPELIEIGLDVLNPVQPASMNPAELKKKYGKNLCFWGSIDEQHTLPFGKPEDVQQEVITRMQTIGKDGGLIIGPTHHVQLDTPMDNFWAMINTVVNTPYSALE
ncbi:MAG: uroporphyrinogen decarboxylase family protein [Chloroflexota bacterium]